MEYKESSRILIDCTKESDDIKSLVVSWKKIWLGKYGRGGIKRRQLEVMKEDMKNGPNSSN